MILAHRIPHLTDQMLTNTRGAATVAEIERLEQRLRYLDGEAEKVRRRLTDVRQLVAQWRRDRNRCEQGG